jgi:hypothetical protein
LRQCCPTGSWLCADEFRLVVTRSALIPGNAVQHGRGTRNSARGLGAARHLYEMPVSFTIGFTVSKRINVISASASRSNINSGTGNSDEMVSTMNRSLRPTDVLTMRRPVRGNDYSALLLASGQLERAVPFLSLDSSGGPTPGNGPNSSTGLLLAAVTNHQKTSGPPARSGHSLAHAGGGGMLIGALPPCTSAFPGGLDRNPMGTSPDGRM